MEAEEDLGVVDEEADKADSRISRMWPPQCGLLLNASLDRSRILWWVYIAKRTLSSTPYSRTRSITRNHDTNQRENYSWNDKRYYKKEERRGLPVVSDIISPEVPDTTALGGFSGYTIRQIVPHSQVAIESM